MNLPSPLPPEPANGPMPTSRLAIVQSVLDASLNSMIAYEAMRETGVQGPITGLRLVLINQIAAADTNRPVAQLMGQSMKTDLTSLAASPLYNRLIQVLTTGLPERFTFTLDTPDTADAREFDILINRIGDLAVVSYNDTTPIKQAELAQRRQTALINSLLAAAPVMFTHFGAVRNAAGQLIDFEVLQANQIAANALDFSVDELVGKRLTNINPTIKNGPVYGEYTTVLETGEPTQFERQEGDKWFLVSVVKFGDGFIMSSVDVTESHLHRQQLEAMNQELLRSNDNLQQFAYVASHDLQEPLRKIQVFGNLLSADYGSQLGQLGQDTISRMQSAANRMSMLITDLLTYSRISSNRQPFQPVDLDQVLAEVLNDLEVRIGETKAVINQTTLPTIPGDPTQLRQLFQNLISNALKFQPGSGERNTYPHIKIDCQQELIEGRMWYDISVSDNGIGFDDRYTDRIFQVFQRLHNKEAYAGTGVGLAICKRVADSHGGTITTHSQPGQGATFLVHLPG